MADLNIETDTILAIAQAVTENVIKAILVGDEKEILRVAKENKVDSSLFKIKHVTNEKEAALAAVQLVHDKQADMLMKGLVETPIFMKAILDKEKGLLPKDGLLSHVALMEIPAYPKLLIVSDAAIIPNPDLDAKVKILEYAVEVAHAIGVAMPKVALVSANETISFKVQSSVDAAVITAMAQRKQIQGAIVDGPLALDLAFSKEACQIKGLETEVGGDTDIAVLPDINTGNVFYKSMSLFAEARLAGLLLGATAPIVLTSRSDSEDSKFLSIAMALRISV